MATAGCDAAGDIGGFGWVFLTRDVEMTFFEGPEQAALLLGGAVFLVWSPFCWFSWWCRIVIVV